MIEGWRLFLAALRFVTQRPAAPEPADLIPSHRVTRFVPLGGILVGAVGAAVFWLAAQLWPTSVAVVVSMLATALVTADLRGATDGALYRVFLVFIKYNALMALSAASLSFPLPEYFALGLIMIAAHAASHALVVSLMATDAPTPLHVSNNDLCVALLVGLAPAAVLGIPGLMGLVAAIVARLAFAAYLMPRLPGPFRAHLDVTRQITEGCFYLGALATWKYI